MGEVLYTIPISTTAVRADGFLEEGTKETEKWKRIKVFLLGEENVRSHSLLSTSPCPLSSFLIFPFRLARRTSPGVSEATRPPTRTSPRTALTLPTSPRTRTSTSASWTSQARPSSFLPIRSLYFSLFLSSLPHLPQFFITEHALYVVMFKLTAINWRRLEYWLQTVASLGAVTPIVVVGTHLDAFKDNKGSKAELMEIEKKLMTLRGGKRILKIFFINSNDMKSVKEVRSYLVEIAKVFSSPSLFLFSIPSEPAHSQEGGPGLLSPSRPSRRGCPSAVPPLDTVRRVPKPRP